MKKISILILVFISFACSNKHITKLKSNSISEDIEWSNTWIVSTNNHDLPRVLLIGDSHVERYYPVVAEKLKGKAYCCKFTTSKSLGDPAIMIQLKALLSIYKFDIITFNNGLHGVNYTDEQYSSYIPKVYKLFKNNNPESKIIWVNTTARRVINNLNEYDKYNPGVINRNKAVETFTKANNIPLIDMYTFTYIHPDYYENDGIHLNKTGVEEEANVIYNNVIKLIGGGNIK